MVSMMQDHKRLFQYLAIANQDFTSLTRFLKILMFSVRTAAVVALPGIDSSPTSGWRLDYSAPPKVFSNKYICDFSP